MIGRQHQHDGIAAVPRLDRHCGQCHRGCGVAAERFQDVGRRPRPAISKLGVEILRVEVESRLVTVTSSATPGSESARAAVFASSVSPSGSRMKAFGAISRDSGHSRVPAPPEMMTRNEGRHRDIREQDLESPRVYPMFEIEVRVRELPGDGGIMTISAHCHDAK